MSVVGGEMKLKRSMKDLLAAWQRVKEQWRDENRRQMEKHLIEPLQQDTRGAQQAMEHMAEVLGRIRQECS